MHSAGGEEMGIAGADKRSIHGLGDGASFAKDHGGDDPGAGVVAGEGVVEEAGAEVGTHAIERAGRGVCAGSGEDADRFRVRARKAGVKTVSALVACPVISTGILGAGRAIEPAGHFDAVTDPDRVGGTADDDGNVAANIDRRGAALETGGLEDEAGLRTDGVRQFPFGPGFGDVGGRNDAPADVGEDRFGLCQEGDVVVRKPAVGQGMVDGPQARGGQDQCGDGDSAAPTAEDEDGRAHGEDCDGCPYAEMNTVVDDDAGDHSDGDGQQRRGSGVSRYDRQGGQAGLDLAWVHPWMMGQNAR